MSSERKQTFIKSALVLVAANFLVKVIGAVFKIPLANLIGKEGMGLFSVAYQIYTFMFVIATAGFPIAISKMVAESHAHGNERDAHRVFETASLLLGVVGIIGSTVLFAFAKPLAGMLGNNDAYLGIITIAPSVFFISIVSAYRGFFQGKQNMYPTAFSEVIEAGAKLLIGYFAASYIMKMAIVTDGFSEIDFARKIVSSEQVRLQYASTGAVFGVMCGTVLALVLLMAIYVFSKKRRNFQAGEMIRSRRNIAKELIRIAIPITIGASVASLTSLIDLATIMNRLVVNPVVFERYAHVFAPGTEFYSSAVKEGWTGITLLEKQANALYGMYNGFAVPMFNLPLTIVVALSMSVVPAIASAIARGNEREGRRTTQSVIRITLLFALPCAVGMSVLSKPILGLLYHDTDAHMVLQKLAIAIVFVSLVSVTNAVLQAYGKVYVPVVNMFVGGVCKVLINYFLIPVWGIDAAPIATNVCYAVIVVLNIYALGKYVYISFNFINTFVSPTISVVVMGVLAFLGYSAMQSILPDKILVVGVMAVSAIVYLILIFLTRAVTRDDVEMLPFGAKLADGLEKMKLLR